METTEQRAIISPMNKPEQPPDGYLRIDAAAQLAQVSEKTIRNWTKAKKIGRRKWKGLALYNADDVAKLAAHHAEVSIVRSNTGPPVLQQLTRAVANAVRQQQAEAPRPADPPRQIAAPELPAAPPDVLNVAVRLPLWLPLADAARFSGLSPARLRELARLQTIRTEHGPRKTVVFNRSDLETFAG